MAVSLMLIFTSCQQGDEEFNQDSLSQEQQIEKMFREMSPSTTEGVYINYNQRVSGDEDSFCKCCEASFTYPGTSNATADVKIFGNNNVIAFQGIVSPGNTYTFLIDICVVYSITTQRLTGWGDHININDSSSTTVVHVGTTEVTYPRYTFTCPIEPPVDECIVTVCLENFIGRANNVHLGVYINGVFRSFLPNQQEGGCFDISIDSGDTIEIRHWAVNPSQNFSFILAISTSSGNNFGYEMNGGSDTTGVIGNESIGCD